MLQRNWKRTSETYSKTVCRVTLYINSTLLLFSHQTNKLPSWGEHLFSTRRVVVVEEAEVDPVARTMVTYTRNLNLRLYKWSK